jgi:endo-1,4-beta-xylanase
VAASLGMQPLGLGNVIHDWDACDDRSVTTLSDQLRTAIAPGAVVLAHDGGGDRATTVDAVALVVAEKLADGFVFTLPRGGAEEHP